VRHEQALSWQLLSSWWALAGRNSEAEPLMLKAIALWKTLVAEQPGVAEPARLLGGTLSNLGQLKLLTGRPRETVPHCTEAIGLLNGVVKQVPGDAEARLFLRNAHWMRAEALTRLGQYADTVADWDRAIALDSGTMRPGFRVMRAGSWARTGKHVEAAAEVERLLEKGGLSANLLYGLACVAGQAAQAAPPGEARDRYADRAMEVLKRAVDAGFTDVRRLQMSSELAPLRQREAYRKLLADLQKKSL
jgi:hypothetical protein